MTSSHDPHVEGDVAVAVAKPKARRPSLWNVVVLNDDFTPMDFVVVVLMDVFGLERKKAIQVMMEVHVRGRAVAGVYPKDVANLKLKMVENLCQAFQHPLLLELEKVEGPEEN